jgi:hypothetical protein
MCFMVLCFSVTATMQAQILKDTASLNLLKSGVDDIYNFRFESAHEVSQKLNMLFPEHPVVYLLNGMITYWENYPLIPTSPSRNLYENDMRNCIKSCEERYHPDDYAESLLANMGARGMLLLYYADNNLSDNVFPMAKTTYRYIRQCFNYTSFYPDFYFFTGLYNYYREAYPDAHPIYKVLALFFPKGDKDKGLRELETAATNSIMLKAESSFFLSHIYLSFEYNYQKAYIFSKSLHELYPGNLEYQAAYIRNMLLLKKYDEAENMIRLSNNISENTFFRSQLTIFNGILQEKKYRNNTLAQKYYNEALNDISVFGYYGNEYSAYAYFGLSRISEINGDRQNRKIYRKKALELTDYRKINFD